MKIANRLILAGLLSRNEIFNLAQGLTVFRDAASKKQFWNRFQKAHIFKAQALNNPIPTPSLSPLPAKAQQHTAAVEGTDAFQEQFGGMQYSFQYVNLVALQPAQVFAFIEPKLIPPAKNKLNALLAFCLPIDPTLDGEVIITPTGVRFTSNRYGMGSQNVVRRIKGHQVILSFEHPNLLQVFNFIGIDSQGQTVNRLIVINGNHRALELLKAGHKKAPAIVITISSIADLAQRLPQNAELWSYDMQLSSPRPPYISDFLTPLAIEVPGIIIPSVVDITVGIPQQTNVPK